MNEGFLVPRMTQSPYVYDVINRVLAEEGISRVYTLMSDATMGIVSRLDKSHDDVTVVHTRHEQGAVAMADGFARATGEIGVCILGKGPALAHTGTALVNARKKGSNILVIVADEPHSKYYDNPVKRFPQTEYLTTTIGGAGRNRYDTSNAIMTIRSNDDIVTKTKDAVRELRLGNGPIAVQVPSDVLNQRSDHSGDWSTYTPTTDSIPETTPRLDPTDDAIANAIDLYLDSDATVAPIIIAGQGAVAADAKEPMYELAERMNAYLVTSMQAHGYVSDHPYGLGPIGTHGHFQANDSLLESDFVLAVGCSLNEFTTDKNHLIGPDAGQKIVQIDTDPQTIGRYTPVDVELVGDAKQTLERLDDALADYNIDRAGEFWTDRKRDEINQRPAYLDPATFETHDDYIDPREVVTTLNDMMPDDRLIVVESGHAKVWALKAIDIPSANDFMWTLDFSAIGQSTPISIGAASADDDRTVFSFCGDAGFMLSLQEVETAVRHDIPLVITIINDSALGSEYHHLVHDGEFADSATLGTPDLGAVAEKLGATGFTVREKSDLEALEETIQHPESPVVIDCKVIRDIEVQYSGPA